MTSVLPNTRLCWTCKQAKDLSAFYPSVLEKKDTSIQCKKCMNAHQQKKRDHIAVQNAEKLYFKFGESIWDGKESADVFGCSTAGTGAALRTLVDRKLVERVEAKKYRVIPQYIRSSRLSPRANNQQSMALDVPQESPIEVIPQPEPKAKPELKGLFLRAGTHLLSLPHIVDIEIAADDSVSIMLNVQETRKDGYIAPVSFKFEGHDARGIVDSISVLQGDLPAEQIKQYEDRCGQAERDRDAALALAAELEKKLSDIRSRLL